MVSTGVSRRSGPAFDRVEERYEHGDHVDRYVVLSELGEGGMGIVYRAYDPKLCREIALKCLRSNALDRAAEARLVREAQVMAKLNHPNVVAVYDVETGPHGLVLAMEYISGGTLKTWLQQTRSWREVVSNFIAAGRGLVAAHEQAIIHRDFKPTNVLVAEDGRVKVTDFGLAKGVLGAGPISGAQPIESGSGDHPSRESDSLDMPLTLADTVMGTPRYMAPEQHAGKDADMRSDQYSFCIALWEALVGHPPFRSRGSALGKDKIAGPPPWPKDIELPKTLVRAIERGLSAAPSRRFPSIEALLEALADDPERRRRSLSAWAGGAALAVAAVGGAYLWTSQRGSVCAGGDEALAEVWNQTRADGLRHRLHAEGGGEAVSSGLVTRLDAHAEQWRAKHREVCEATRLRGEQSESALELRMACLERQRRQLEVVVDALAVGALSVSDRGVVAVETVEPPSACDDIETLREDPAPVWVDDDELDRELRRFEVAALTGQIETSTALRDRLSAKVRIDDRPVVRIRFQLASGYLAEASHAPEPAQEHFRLALSTAMEHGPPRLALQAAVALIRVTREPDEQRWQAQWAARIARGLARRVDFGGRLEVAIATEMARISAEAQEYETAASSLRAVLPKVRGGPLADYGEDRVVAELTTISAMRGDAEGTRRHLAEARSLYERRWGSGHVRFGRSLVDVGAAMRRGGQAAQAVGVLEEAKRLFKDAGRESSFDSARGLLELARAKADAGDEASAPFEAASTSLEAALGKTHPLVIDAKLERAQWLRDSGDLGSAAVLYVQVLPDIEIRFSKAHPQYVRALAELASTRREQGEPREAIELLRRARNLLGDVRVAADLQLRIALSLAELQTDRDPTTAERYLEEAKALAGDDADPSLVTRLNASEQRLKPSRTRR